MNDIQRKRIAENFGVKLEEVTDEFINKAHERLKDDPQYLVSVRKIPEGIEFRMLNNNELTVLFEKCKIWGQEIKKEIQNKKESTAS